MGLGVYRNNLKTFGTLTHPNAQRKKNIHPKLEFDKTEPTEPLVWPPKLNLEPTEPQRLYEPPNRTRFHPSLV